MHISDWSSDVCSSDLFTFDGDTPGDARQAIRLHGDIVVSNPDMLHQAILPHHTKWAQFFENLRYVVIDEVHTYRGVFGSHVANVLRSEEHTSELQSLMRISYAVFCLKKKKKQR